MAMTAYEVKLTPPEEPLRAFVLEKYRVYSDLVQFYMKFLIAANGFYFAIAGGIFTIVVADGQKYPPYFALGLLIPVIFSGSFIYLCSQALDGAKKLAESIIELREALSMRTGPFSHSIFFLLWIFAAMHLFFLVLTLFVVFDVLDRGAPT